MIIVILFLVTYYILIGGVYFQTQLNFSPPPPLSSLSISFHVWCSENQNIFFFNISFCCIGPRTENFCSRIIPNISEPPNDPAPAAANLQQPYTKTLLDLPEEIICMILVKLDLVSVAALQQACKHLHQLMVNARVWRRLLVHKVENEPGLRRFLPKHLQNNFASKDLDESRFVWIFLLSIFLPLNIIIIQTKHVKEK